MSKPEEKPIGSSPWGPMVRTGLAAVPYVGGVVVTAWSEWDTRRRFERVESTLADLARMLNDLRGMLNPDRLGEPEMQILEAVLNRVQSEHREKKRVRFARLVASDWSERVDRPFDERMQFVRALDELDELHIELLDYLEKQAVAERMPGFDEIAGQLRIPGEQRGELLIPALNTLASSYGFIRRGWGKGVPLSRGNLNPEGIARGCEHAVTDAGRRFLQAVSVPATRA